MSSHASARIAASARSQQAVAASRSVRGISTTNSSPPVRATTSEWRTTPSSRLGDADEHLVAGVVAVVVVDALEVVEVEDGEAEGGLGAVELAGEVAAVVQAGQPVAVGLLAELLLERLELDVRCSSAAWAALSSRTSASSRAFWSATHGGLERRALEVDAQLGELAQALALELGAAAERVVGVLDAAGLAQRGGDRAEDEAARVRDLVAEALERALAGAPRVVEPVQRGQRLHLRRGR